MSEFCFFLFEWGEGADISCNMFYSAILLGVKLVVCSQSNYFMFFFQIIFFLGSVSQAEYLGNFEYICF